MSWLTKLFGFDEIIVAKDSEIVNLYTQLHNRDRMLELKDHEIRRLTDLMLKEHGVIHDFTEPKNLEQPRLVNRRTSWPQRQKELERLDRTIAQKPSDPVGEMADRWNKKSEKAMQEGV